MQKQINKVITMSDSNNQNNANDMKSSSIHKNNNIMRCTTTTCAFSNTCMMCTGRPSSRSRITSKNVAYYGLPLSFSVWFKKIIMLGVFITSALTLLSNSCALFLPIHKVQAFSFVSRISRISRSSTCNGNTNKQRHILILPSSSKSINIIYNRHNMNSYNNNRHHNYFINCATVEQSQSHHEEQENNYLNMKVNDIDHKNQYENTPIMSLAQDSIETFDSYARNIARTRPFIHKREKVHTRSDVGSGSDSGSGSGNSLKSMNVHPSYPEQITINYNPNTCMVAIKSLLHTLQTQSQTWKDLYNTTANNTSSHNTTTYTIITKSQCHKLQQNLNTAIIQAIRAAADYGDYNIILKLIQSSINYATAVAMLPLLVIHDDNNNNNNVDQQQLPQQQHHHHHDQSIIQRQNNNATTMSVPLLTSRIFGEAITELKRTKVSASKIKKLWNMFVSLGITHQHSNNDNNNNNDNDNEQQQKYHQPNVLLTSPSAFELNAMLMTISSRGKIRAALSLFYKHVLDDNSKHHHHDDTNGDDQEEDDSNENFYNNQTSSNLLHINGDEYTTSTIMNILASSVASDVVQLSNTNNIQQHPQQQQLSSSSSSSSSTTSKKTKKVKNLSSNNPSSPCWQWREAEFILNHIENDKRVATTMLNNHVYAAVLKVNEEASQLYKYPGNRHFGSTSAMVILERMKQQHISPDVVTCSAVMTAFDRGMQWKAALALLKSMQRGTHTQRVASKQMYDEDYSNDSNDSNDSSATNNVKKEKWQLPSPNQYTYASAISSCARSGRFDEAMDILDSLRTKGPTSSSSNIKRTREMMNYSNTVTPNIWMYNAALSACMPAKIQSKKHQLQNRKRSKTAIEILSKMKEDSNKGMDTAPDTVSYNTIIASMGYFNVIDFDDINSDTFKNDLIFTDDEQSVPTEIESNVVQLLDEMKENNVLRDPITYRNAILVCQDDAETSVRLLDMALVDSDNFTYTAISKWGSMTNIKSYLINVAMSVCARKGDMSLIAKLFDYMRRHSVHADSRSMNHLIIALSTAGYCENSMWVLNAMKGDGAANAMFQEEYNINIIESGNFIENPMIEEYHYSSAITCCLRKGKLFPALKILNGMKVHGLRPNDANLHGIIVAYCKLATEASTVEFKEAKAKDMNDKKKTSSRSPILHVEYKTSRDRAIAALAMLKSLKEAPFRLTSIVASACAASGMWVEARDLLWSMHISAVKERYRENKYEILAQNQGRGSAIAELPKLHTSLLKLCARSGNITAALWYSDAIQDLAFKFERRQSRERFNATSILSDFENKDIAHDTISASLQSYKTGSRYGTWIGMGCEEWKLVNIAASKSRHWKVSLGILQFLKPYVEATHPNNIIVMGDEEDLNESVMTIKLNQDYEGLARTLTDSILAFEARGQYAWALRAIDDWIEWCGRRPRREAVFAACRILAKRGLGNQVASLVRKLLSIPPHETLDDAKSNNDEDGIPSYEASYERAVYTEAITSLFQYGLYDNADELYATAASQGYLPWAVVDKRSSSRLQLDLHGMNKAMAHSGVRVSLQQIANMKAIAPNGIIGQNVMIVTGKGARSSQHLRPVLRPEVQRMLMQEFYPPISSTSVPGNMGALTISSEDINAWLGHQKQQRGVRFLAMADVLKSLTSGERLKRIIKLKLEGSDSPPSSS